MDLLTKRNVLALLGGLLFGYNLTINVPMALVGAGALIYAIWFWKEDE